MSIFWLLFLPLLNGYILPGTKPKEYQTDAAIELKVVQLDSVKTQIPFSYYQLPFCNPARIFKSAENLGELLSGDVIENTDYEIKTKKIESCKILCMRDYKADELKIFEDKIRDEYRVNMLLDNLPAATKYSTDSEGTSLYEKGFLMGFVGMKGIGIEYPKATPGKAYINNHIRLNVFLHEDISSFQGYRVVGFEIEPFSVAHSFDSWHGLQTQLTTCNPLNMVSRDNAPQSVSEDPSSPGTRKIVWTYDNSAIKWAARWDQYLRMHDTHIHWFSIINSIVIIFCLSAMVAIIVIRALRRDLLRYNTPAEDREAAEEETGWKLVHGEVFRAPVKGGLLCVFVGTGLQVLGMLTLVVIFAALGFLSPANPGTLLTAFLILFAFMGTVAGYFSTRLYKLMELTDWRQNTLYTAMVFPTFCFVVFFSLNLVMWSNHSSAAVPFFSLVSLLVLWFGISVPLVYLGASYGFNSEVKSPCKTLPIPRMTPELPWYLKTSFCVFVGGILSFGAIYIEVFFIMTSVWHHQFYYMFGFLLLVLAILLITCSEITIVLTYFQLCSEDYHWWWRSFFTSASAGLYLFLYSGYYFFTKLNILRFEGGLLFFGYMFLISVGFGFVTGAIGFMASYIFVNIIYGSVKVE